MRSSPLTIGLASTLGGSAAPGAGAATAQVASVLSDGMDRILSLDLPLIEPRPDRAHPAVARHTLAVARRTSRPRYVPEPVHYTPSPPTNKRRRSYPSVEAAPAQAGRTRRTDNQTAGP